MALRPRLRSHQLVLQAGGSFTRNARTLASPRSSQDNDDDEEQNALQLRRRASAPVASTFLTGEGGKFKRPKKGPNWIGGDVPFPLNPSFRPPPPLSDSLKSRMYKLYMYDPRIYNIRALSQSFGVSMKRVDAVLRLKGLEQMWDEAHCLFQVSYLGFVLQEGKCLQSGFALGMDMMLNARQDIVTKRDEPNFAADLQDDNEDNNRDRDRYQRHFWEPLVEGEHTVVSKALEKAREEAKAAHVQSRAAKSDPALLGKVKKPYRSATPRMVLGDERPGRPVTSFKDVGGKFLDTNDRVRRMHEAQRRKEKESRRRMKVPGP